jgi:hypothetical protein
LETNRAPRPEASAHDHRSLFSICVRAMLSFPATVDIFGVELGTLGVILLILVLLAGLALGLLGLSPSDRASPGDRCGGQARVALLDALGSSR